MADYFDKFQADERKIRNAVGEIFANLRLEDEVAESPTRRVTTQGVTYGHGSKEVKPGTVKSPGTRRVGAGPKRYRIFSET